MLIQRKNLPIASEAKVGNAPWNDYLAQKDASRRPYVDTVCAATIDIARHVTFDAVWDSRVCQGKHSTIHEERLFVSIDYIKRITAAA